MLHLIWSRYGADLGGSGWDGMGTWRRDTSEYIFVHGLPCSTLHRKSLAGTPCHPSWLYLHNSRKARNNDGLFGGLVLPLRLFVWHLGYLFFPKSLPALNITESRHLPSDSLLGGQGLCIWFFTPASLELGERNHFFWGAHPNAVFGTRQHFWLTAGIFLKQRKKQQGQELLQRGLAPGALEIPADLRCTLLWWAHFFGCMLHISVLKYPEDSSYGLYPHCQYSRAHGKKMASLRPASAIWQAPSQPGLYSKTLSQTKQNKSLWKSGKQIVELM